MSICGICACQRCICGMAGLNQRSQQFAESIKRHCAKERPDLCEPIAVNLRFRVNGKDVPAEEFAEAVARTMGEGNFRHEILVADDLHEVTTPEDEAKVREWFGTIGPRASGGTAHHDRDVAAYIVGDMVAEEAEPSAYDAAQAGFTAAVDNAKDFEAGLRAAMDERPTLRVVPVWPPNLEEPGVFLEWLLEGTKFDTPWARYALNLRQALLDAKAADAGFYRCPGERERTVWGHVERALALPMPGEVGPA